MESLASHVIYREKSLFEIGEILLFKDMQIYRIICVKGKFVILVKQNVYCYWDIVV